MIRSVTRFDNLVARYNVLKVNFYRMSGMREKKMAQVKEKIESMGGSGAGQTKARVDRNTMELSNSDMQQDHLETFYARYVELKTIHEGLVTLSYEDFNQKISGKLNSVKLGGTGKGLQLRLVEEDGKVKIKTKVVKE